MPHPSDQSARAKRSCGQSAGRDDELGGEPQEECDGQYGECGADAEEELDEDVDWQEVQWSTRVQMARLRIQRDEADQRSRQMAARIQQPEEQLGQSLSRASERRKKDKATELHIARLRSQLDASQRGWRVSEEIVARLRADIAEKDAMIHAARKGMEELSDHLATPEVVANAVKSLVFSIGQDEEVPQDLELIS
jgi:chromosome segregation ATPase